MARITGTSDREKRKSRSSNRPITQGQNPQRSNRQGVSRATVSNGDSRTRTGTARVTSGQEPPKPVTRQSRVNGRLVAGTDKRQLPSQKPAAKPAGPTPYQVSDPWAKPARPSIGNVSGPASKPNRPAGPSGPNGPVRPSIGNVSGPASSPNRPGATPKPAAKPSGNFKAPTVPKPPTRYPSSPLTAQPTGNKMGRIGAGGPLRGGAQAALLAAGQVGVDALAPILGKGLAGALTPVGRRIDDMLPGVNSKDEARRVKAKTPLPTMTAAQRAKAVRLPQAKGDPTPKPPAPPKLPAASTTASRPSSNSGSGSNSYSGSSRPSIRAAAASKKAEPGQSKDMNENYRAWAAANPTLAARVKKGQSGYNAFSKDAVAGTGPVKDGNDYKPSVSNSDTANTSSDKDKKKKVNG